MDNYNVINSVSISYGGTTIVNGNYWTSTNPNETTAYSYIPYSINFYNPSIGSCGNSSNNLSI